MKWCIFTLLAACGRVGFDATTRDGNLDSLDAFACPAGTPTDPLVISGSTFRYTTFDNHMASVGGVTVQTTGGYSTTSTPGGAYSLTIPGGANANITVLGYSVGGFQPTSVFLDAPLTRDLSGGLQPVWSPGDGPIWSTSALDSIYATASSTRDPMKGTLNIAVRDCAGNPLEGVQITIAPPPPATFYLAPSGMPDMTATATQAPFTHLIALNVAPQLIHVTASAPGLRFTELTIPITANISSIGILHGGP